MTTPNATRPTTLNILSTSDRDATPDLVGTANFTPTGPSDGISDSPSPNTAAHGTSPKPPPILARSPGPPPPIPPRPHISLSAPSPTTPTYPPISAAPPAVPPRFSTLSAHARPEVSLSPASVKAVQNTGLKTRRRRGSLRTNLLRGPRRAFADDTSYSPVLGSSTGPALLSVGGGAASVGVAAVGRLEEEPTTTEHEEDGLEDEVSAYEGAIYGPRRRSDSSAVALGLVSRTRQQELDSAADTVYWGFVLLMVTWIVWVVGMGSMLGIWDWAWDVGKTPWPDSVHDGKKEKDGAFPITGYYPAVCVMSCVVAWVWVVVAWVGMKYFKHAKIQS